MAEQTENHTTDTQKLKALIESIESIMTCPKCSDTIRSTFKLCWSGHVLCLDCARGRTKCPCCNKPLILKNPVSLKNIMEVLPRLCCYSSKGCDEVLENGNHLEHEKFCGFRQVACRRPDCKQKMPLIKIIDHYRAHHSKAYIFTEETKSVRTQIKCGEKFIEYTPVLLNTNMLFWLVEVNNTEKKEFKIYFHATPLAEINCDYYARITFEKGNFNYTYTLRAKVLDDCEEKLTWEDVKNQDKNELPTEEYCWRIPLSLLRIFMKDSELQFKCFFFQM